MTDISAAGKDMAASLLDKYSRGTGEIPYMLFITNVLELQPDALQPPKKVRSTVLMVKLGGITSQTVRWGA